MKWQRNVAARAAATMTVVPVAVSCPASAGGPTAQQTTYRRDPGPPAAVRRGAPGWTVSRPRRRLICHPNQGGTEQ